MSSTLCRAGFGAASSLALAMLVSMPAAAQSVPAGADWTHGTTLNLFAGAATDSSNTGPFAGGGVGWEIKPSLAVEGSMGWIDRPGHDTSAYTAGLKALFSFPKAGDVVPFLTGGVGLYRASFGLGSEMPEFYSRRVSTSDLGQPGPYTFTDPAYIFGGGLNVYLNRHLAIRPDVEVMWIRGDSESFFVTGIAVHFAYHFENHPVTPARR